ncbi:hypothetical protein HHK36_004251 [Tetracentron sinense]|uniref:ENTH domain-containing protein n=1 Tax=Tetracentron sinense TaxID=13715 RepID=A0A835DQ12_TETSI|nr:hypothetical protein HHK36_004251 [Tetracentron sinense]
MAPSKIRKALGAVKDTTSIGLAKVSSSSNAASDLDVAIVKATRHEEYPADEKHIREILSLTCYSRSYISACINTLSRRLNKTRNWTVALKTLMLIHRLLTEGDPAYEQEIFFATRRGTRLLNMSEFRDASQSDSWDYSAFVRTYALYLDERLEYRMQGRREKCNALGFDEDEEEADSVTFVLNTPPREMKIERVFIRAQHLQQLLRRFLACRPTGAAKNNRVVIVALHTIVKESFQLYTDITEIMGILIDRFMELDVPDCAKVYEIFSRIGKQFAELDMFYNWCKTIGVARSSEYPEVERIASRRLKVMDEFIRDKSILATHSKRQRSLEQKKMLQEAKQAEVREEEMNTMKALPPPEGFCYQEKEDEIKQEEKEKESDLLNLWEDTRSSEEQGDKLALALFDDGAAASAAQPARESFTSGVSPDWESALVESASNLSNQKTSLGGGFDMLLLNGMYQQSAVATAMAGGATGSASSVAFESSGKPAMLALPAPPVSRDDATTAGADPFAASLSVAPPAYVRMSDMEKKQKLLMEEQLMWQQYERDGMQGQLGFAKLQANPYTMGGYR